MPGRRRLLMGTLGVGACLLGGCLRGTVPEEVRRIPSNVSAHAKREPLSEDVNSESEPSDYQVSQTPLVPPDVQASANPGKRVEPVEMRLKDDPTPAPTTEQAEPRMEVQPAPPSPPDPALVQVLRALLNHRSEEEIKDQLQSYDTATRQAILLLLHSVVQLEQGGGVAHLSPRELAAWTERLNGLTCSLRCRAQLILERMCFCSHIKSFGDFTPLPPEHAFFQPGETAHVYVQVRNFSSRRQQENYLTVLKGRIEIFEEHNRDKPMITWISELKHDASSVPRQDYFINFHFDVPRHCPPGLYTARILVEDWTDASEEAKQVPPSRLAQRTLDFRVGSSGSRSARIVNVPPASARNE